MQLVVAMQPQTRHHGMIRLLELCV